MKNELICIKKLNMFKVMATVTVAFILLVLMIIVTYKFVVKNIIKSESNDYANVFYQTRQNEIIEEQEKIRAEEERNEKRYAKLSSEDIDKFVKIYRHSDVKRVFLTFDDGPSKTVTPLILDLLKKENVKANFFVLGSRVEQNPEVLRRIYEEGHFIGNHGYSHKYSKIYESVDSVLNEYNVTNQIIKRTLKIDKFESLVFRFPGGVHGGFYNDLKLEAANKLKEEGIANVDWNALTNDAAGATTKEAIMENFYKTTKDLTSIVLLMHDAPDKILTYECLTDIIHYLKDNGYKFETMYEAIGRE